MSLNSVNIMGNLTRDPELKYTNSGTAVCNLSIANNRVYSTKSGEKREEVSFFDVETWGSQAENCAKYLSKGSGIIVEGRLKQDRWEQDGKTRSRVRISAISVHFMPKRSGGGGGNYDESSQKEPAGSSQSSQSGQSGGSDNDLSQAIAWDE